jgi:hypothetical protein
MSKLLQLRGGTTSEHSSFTGALREVTVDTTKDTLVVHDGSTAAGFALARESALTTTTDLANAALPKSGGALTGALTTNSTIDGVDIATRDGILTSTTSTANAALPKAGGTVTGDIWHGDNVGAKFGTSGDFRVYHDGFHSYIRDYGTGDLIVTGSVIRLKSSGYEDMAAFTENGAVTLFYDNATKLATASAGVDVTGNLAVSGTVDGRDVATDGTKLDGIEASATADQTDAEIKTAVEAATNIALGGSPTTTTQSAADNSTKVATTAYADAAVAALADSAPSTLNTLNELAAALGDDANYATTTTTAIGTKMPLAGGAFTGAVTTNSTFDGRDVATDGTKLDGIEANATADQTAAQIKTHLENGIDSVHYVDGSIDAEHIADRAVTGTKIALDLRTGNAGHDNYWGNNDDYIFCDASTGMRFYTAGAEDMRLTDGGDLHVDNDVIAFSTTISDKRLKHDIEPITDALYKVGQLNGVTFTYNKNDRKSAGLIAQDVEKVLPSAVTEAELPLQQDDGTAYKTVQYDQTIGLLVEAIKELTDKVEKLENK